MMIMATLLVVMSLTIVDIILAVNCCAPEGYSDCFDFAPVLVNVSGNCSRVMPQVYT